MQDIAGANLVGVSRMFDLRPLQEKPPKCPVMVNRESVKLMIRVECKACLELAMPHETLHLAFGTAYRVRKRATRMFHKFRGLRKAS
jgi:hypothetical protein